MNQPSQDSIWGSGVCVHGTLETAWNPGSVVSDSCRQWRRCRCRTVVFNQNEQRLQNYMGLSKLYAPTSFTEIQFIARKLALAATLTWLPRRVRELNIYIYNEYAFLAEGFGICAQLVSGVVRSVCGLRLRKDFGGCCWGYHLDLLCCAYPLSCFSNITMWAIAKGLSCAWGDFYMIEDWKSPAKSGCLIWWSLCAFR